jgi:hypothetical protein
MKERRIKDEDEDLYNNILTYLTKILGSKV